jgi:hypothetical protein
MLERVEFESKYIKTPSTSQLDSCCNGKIDQTHPLLSFSNAYGNPSSILLLKSMRLSANAIDAGIAPKAIDLLEQPSQFTPG